jgi:Predicted aminopeptidases
VRENRRVKIFPLLFRSEVEMSKKIRILFALVLSVTLPAVAAFLIFNRADAGLEKTILTMDIEELRQMQAVAAGEKRPLDVEILRVENGIAVVRATEDQITQISEHSHEEFHKCGGFIAHESEAEALQTIANFARAENAAQTVVYTIDNASTVQNLLNEMAASNIVDTITYLSTNFTTRYYKAESGLQSATWIKNTWESLAAGRDDVAVEFFNHPSWLQPSVILTIQGTSEPSEVVVLGAHQDSIRSGCSDSSTCLTLPAPGADDDASGIASLTEVIRVAMETNYRPAKTVKFMAYAGEERGLLGSAAIASNYQSNGVNVIGVLQLDMTNYKGSTTTDIAIFTDYTNSAQNQFLRDLISTYLPNLSVSNSTCGYGCSDHASWHNRGYPASFPHESPFNVSNPRIHTANDTLENSDTTGAHALKFSKLAAAYMAELAKGSQLTVEPSQGATRADFDGDGRTDVSVFRPENGVWYIDQSGTGTLRAENFGIASDILVPADYDGDGKTDLGVFRNGNWYVLKSSNAGFSAVQFGAAGDKAVAQDYDGDGKADSAVYRDGSWYILKSSDGQFYAVQLGAAGDLPVMGDFDGDGKADPTVFRPSDGVWYQQRSTEGFAAVQFGISTDKPVPADYDGDGKTDIAVYRDGMWYLLRSTAGFTGIQFGIAGDTPAPGDYDGDGSDDISVYRGGTWFIMQSSSGFRAQAFGLASDKPAPTAYLP